jgi:hypothetical protein
MVSPKSAFGASPRGRRRRTGHAGSAVALDIGSHCSAVAH